MQYSKIFCALATLIYGLFIFCPSASALPRARKSTAALGAYAQPGKAKGSYGTPEQLAKVVKVQQKKYKKALKKYEKEVKKAEKLAKKREKARKKAAAKEAKRRAKLRKKLQREKAKEKRRKELAEEESADEGGEDIDGSIIVKDDPAKEERSFFSKITDKYTGDKKAYQGTKKKAYKGKKLDKSKLNWWSRLFLDWFGTA
jgi:hypothetical protein